MKKIGDHIFCKCGREMVPYTKDYYLCSCGNFEGFDTFPQEPPARNEPEMGEFRSIELEDLNEG